MWKNNDCALAQLTRLIAVSAMAKVSLILQANAQAMPLALRSGKQDWRSSGRAFEGREPGSTPTGNALRGNAASGRTRRSDMKRILGPPWAIANNGTSNTAWTKTTG